MTPEHPMTRTMTHCPLHYLTILRTYNEAVEVGLTWSTYGTACTHSTFAEVMQSLRGYNDCIREYTVYSKYTNSCPYPSGSRGESAWKRGWEMATACGLTAEQDSYWESQIP